MADFNHTRQTLQRLRVQHQELLDSQYQLQQRLVMVTEQLEDAAPDVPAALLQEQTSLEEQLAAAAQPLRQAEADLAAAVRAFHEMGSPQALVEHLDDGVPFLLMPVRLETRFITVKHVTRALHRPAVFDASDIRPAIPPPDMSQPALVSQIPQLASLKAGGQHETAARIEQQIHAGTFVPGGGQWLPRMEDGKELWVRIFPDDVFLHSHEAALLPAEYEAGQAYWHAVWGAERQTEPPQAESTEASRREQKWQAWKRLQQTFKAPRAKWIVHATQPRNFAGDQTDYAQAPMFPEVTLKAEPWTQAPQTFVLPDCFVVRLYSESMHRDVIGNPIDHSLVLGLDPQNDDFDAPDEVMELSEKFRWVSDFETAERMGMAIRVPLSAEEFAQGFDRVIVLGLRLSTDQTDSQALLEDLFYNHQYKSDGCAFVPQGTPTNTIGKHRAEEDEEAQESAAYLRWAQSTSVSTPGAMSEHHQDGQRLAVALGVEPAVFHRLLHSDREDVREALAMNHLLWPATMGYFLRQFLSPLIDEETLKQTRAFFSRFVTGRGLLPCFRVGNQPYGVLPASAFSRWDYPAGNRDDDFCRALFRRILRPLDHHWHTLAQGVIHVADPLTHSNQFSDRLIQLLGLHAASVDFYVRTLVDPFFSDDVMPVTIDKEMDDAYWKIMNGLRDMGLHFEAFETPTRIFDMLYSQDVRRLDGPLIDALPLSETRTLQKLPDADENYIDWLAKGDLLQDLRPEAINLPADQGLPLLYILLRHGVLREYINAAITLLKEAGMVSPVADIDQEREEADRLGANHEYVLRTTLQLKWQRLVVERMQQLYQQLIDAGINTASIAAFEQSVATAFDVFHTSTYISDTVAEAAAKLRQRLIPPPSPSQVSSVIADFVNDVEEAIQNAVDTEFQSLTSALLTVEPDKWQLLSQPFAPISGTQTMLEFMQAQLHSDEPAAVLQDLVKMQSALEVIKDLPTARLERLLVEHIDLCNYRLDAWLLGLVHQRLEQQRKRHPHGIFLGAFGYVEDLRPGRIPGLSVRHIAEPELLSFRGGRPRLNEITVPVLNVAGLQAEGVDVDRLIEDGFVYLGSDTATAMIEDALDHHIIPEPRLDTVGEGFIHTPSLVHANAAAILRAGYATYNADATPPTATDPLAVNLSSHRVRKALYYLDGIRNGQELGALLGYQFERALHAYADKTPLNTAFVSKVAHYILALRQRFPLRRSSQQTDDGGHDAVFNVVDGRALLQAFQQRTKIHWSTGILTDCPPAHRSLLDQELHHLEESLDALSDVLVAESVYQMAKGNPERSAAALRVLNDSGTLEKPEVIRTPQRGFHYWQRVGMVLTDRHASPVAWGTVASPRAQLNPSINQWLSRQLPAPSRIAVTLLLSDHQRHTWSFDQGNFQPIDLLPYTTDKQDPMAPDSELCLRIAEQARQQMQLDAHTAIQVDCRQREGLTDDQYTLFELLPLLRALSRLLGLARPMFPEDLVVPSETAQGATIGDLRVEAMKDALHQLLAESGALSLAALTTRLQQAQHAVVADLEHQDDVQLEQGYANLYRTLLEVAVYGMPEALPATDRVCTPGNVSTLSLQAGGIVDLLHKKIAAARTQLQALSSAVAPRAQWDRLVDVAQLVCGSACKIFPTFMLSNASILASALDRDSLHHDGREFAKEEWLQSVSLVRLPVKTYSQLSLLRDVFSTADRHMALQIIQLPHGQAPWIADSLPRDELINGDTLSLALEVDGPLTVEQTYVGFVIDEWQEVIPDTHAMTGVAFNYNQPDCEAPQVVLLAVSPHETGRWQWDDLMETVRETMDMAKKRAVDPDLIKAGYLDHFLPAVTGPINDQDLYPAADFAKTIKINTGNSQ